MFYFTKKREVRLLTSLWRKKDNRTSGRDSSISDLGVSQKICPLEWIKRPYNKKFGSVWVINKYLDSVKWRWRTLAKTLAVCEGNLD